MAGNGLLHAEITDAIIGAAVEVHRELGPGLLENAYEACLAHLLMERELVVERQKPLPVVFRGVRVECGYRLDLVVANKVIVEVKAMDALDAIHEAQLMTYLRLAHCRVGLLMNFNVRRLKDGVVRRVI